MEQQQRANVGGRSWVGKTVFVAVLVLLFGAIAVSTQYRTAAEGAAIASGLNPDKNFDPAATAAELFAIIQTDLPPKANQLTQVAPEIMDNLGAAGAAYGQDLGADSYAFPVAFTGTVDAVDDKFMTFTVDGMPAGQSVVVPLGAALNGGPVRDALGIIQFGDVPDQIAFQSLAQEVKKIMIDQVVTPANASSLQGKTVTVYGAYKSGGPAGTWIIQPVKIEVTS